MAMALENVRVLDFSQMMMGPWGTQFLGDMGAEIIKIERPKLGEWERSLHAMGELMPNGESPYFVAMNRNKKSLTLNLKSPQAREIIYKLAKDSDLVVENFRPGVLDRLGIGYEDLRKINPSIVYVAGSGWGRDGPYVDRPGQDMLAQCMSGLAAYGGRSDDPPTPCGSSIVDAITAMHLAFCSMVGLYHKQRTGQGQRIDVDLFSTIIAAQCQELSVFLNMERKFERSRTGIGGAWLSAPFGIYQTADGHMAISMNPLPVLADLLDLPELKQYDTERKAYDERDTIKPMIERVIRTKTTAHWLELFATRDLWCAKVQDFGDVERDPQVAHNNMIVEVEHPREGTIRLTGVPSRFSQTPGSVRLAPPTVGQHNHEILSQLGYSREQIEQFASEGVI